MTRNDDTSRVKFGAAEWIAIAGLIVGMVAAWTDMRVQSAVQLAKLERIERSMDDFESRFRVLERVKP